MLHIVAACSSISQNPCLGKVFVSKKVHFHDLLLLIKARLDNAAVSENNYSLYALPSVSNDYNLCSGLGLRKDDFHPSPADQSHLAVNKFIADLDSRRTTECPEYPV